MPVSRWNTVPPCQELQAYCSGLRVHRQKSSSSQPYSSSTPVWNTAFLPDHRGLCRCWGRSGDHALRHRLHSQNAHHSLQWFLCRAYVPTRPRLYWLPLALDKCFGRHLGHAFRDVAIPDSNHRQKGSWTIAPKLRPLLSDLAWSTAGFHLQGMRNRWWAPHDIFQAAPYQCADCDKTLPSMRARPS